MLPFYFHQSPLLLSLSFAVIRCIVFCSNIVSLKCVFSNTDLEIANIVFINLNIAMKFTDQSNLTKKRLHSQVESRNLRKQISRLQKIKQNSNTSQHKDQSPVPRIPIPNDTFHQLVNDVCAGKAIDERYGQIEDWDVSQVRDMSHAFEEQDDFNRDIHHIAVTLLTTQSFNG